MPKLFATVLVLASAPLLACNSPSSPPPPEPTPDLNATVEAAVAATKLALPTATPTPTPEPTATHTPVPTATPIPTPTPTATPEPTLTPLPTATPRPTATPAGVPTATPRPGRIRPGEWEWFDKENSRYGFLQAGDYAVSTEGKLSRALGDRPEKRPVFGISQRDCGVLIFIFWNTKIQDSSEVSMSEVSMFTGTGTGRKFDLDEDTKTQLRWDASEDGTSSVYPSSTTGPYSGSDTKKFLDSLKGATQMGVIVDVDMEGSGKKALLGWFKLNQLDSAISRVIGTCR